MAPQSAISPSEGAAGTAPPRALAVGAMLGAWGQSVLSPDSATFMHCARVAVYSLEVARALGLDEAQIATLQLGATLHDIGKIRVPGAILYKAGRLTSDEFDVVKQHPVWGLELLEAVECPAEIRTMVRFHHEKYDGTGYPDRLMGDQIPVAAAIIGVADVYDALTTRRCYRPPLPRHRALLEMEFRRRWWHPDVYAAFRRALGRRTTCRVAFDSRRRISGRSAALTRQ